MGRGRPMGEQEYVCKALFTNIKEEELTNVQGITKKFKVACCPGRNCKLDGPLKWESGWTNPFNHFLVCFAKKNKAALKVLADKANEEKEKQRRLPFCPVEKIAPAGLRVSGPQDKAMHKWVELIVCKNSPLSHVDDPLFREMVYGSTPSDAKLTTFGSKQVRDTILMLSYIVETQIKDEMKLTSAGTILHDGWSRYSSHYVCVIACYCKGHNEEVITSMLACCEMPEVNGEATAVDTDNLSFFQRYKENSSTSEFTAKVHVNFIREHVFGSRYGFSKPEFEDWVVAQTADSASTNKKTARDLKVPHIPCNNHLLNHQVEEMLKATTTTEGNGGDGNGLGDAVNKVHESMTKLKGSNKNMGVLRKHTHYKPQLRNQTRWTGVFTMMDNFLRMRNPMILALTDKDTDFPMDQSEDFEAKARNIRKMLFNINEVTKLLQTSKQPLHWSRRYLDSLINQANSLREEPQSEWYGNQFGGDYIGPNSMKIPTESKHFISGVIKIQRGHVTEMTEAEKSACKKMKRAPAAAGADADDKEEDFLSQLKRLKELERSSSAAAGRKRSHIQISTAGNQADECWDMTKYEFLRSKRNYSSTRFLTRAIGI
ncbi:unnamed protein product [Cylindrotheca closterium]|uniref:Uncharacterized protein n=1 Tax=Cylindrotheca closterium TaxID=2856 RepID=A0AAD2CJB2_9STRA|nr:unnamed protein product [Cylindrotheca closterium]